MRTFLLPLVILLALGCGDDDGVADSGMADTSTADTGRSDSGGDDAGDDDGGGVDAGTDDAGGTDGGDDAGGDDAATDDAGAPSRECTTDEDCQLINDCCSCAAASADAIIAECPVDCLQPLCNAAGIDDPTVECLAGTCTLRRLNCDESEVECDAPPPACEAGAMPHVQDGCWSNLCVPIESCSSVPSCDTCPDGQACVSSQAFFETITCVPVDPACGGTPTCACMGDEACGGSPFMCIPTTTGEQDLTCICPVC